MTLDPPRRRFEATPGARRGPRDVDAAGRARSLHALGWALFGGGAMGFMGGFFLGHPFLGALVGTGVVWGVGVGLSALAARGAASVTLPSGSSTPHRKEYSRAAALAVRGDWEGAIREYEGAIAAAPQEPEPYLRIARLLRDEVKRPEEGARWFRRARREATLSPGQELRTLRETAEIFLHHLGEPRKAAPELARLAEAFPGTPDGAWAREELARIKEEMARETETGGERNAAGEQRAAPERAAAPDDPLRRPGGASP